MSEETTAELAALQELLDSSIDRAGPFLRSSFQMPERSLSAVQLAERLTGVVNLAMATVTAGGEPRVAPIGALFLHGRFHIPTVAEAARVGHLRRNPAVSLTVFEDVSWAVIVHGTARIVGVGDPGYDEAERAYRALTGESIADWSGNPVFIVVAADRIFTYDRGGDPQVGVACSTDGRSAAGTSSDPVAHPPS